MIKNDFKEKIEQLFDEKVIKMEALTSKVTLLSFTGKKYIVKKVNICIKLRYILQ